MNSADTSEKLERSLKECRIHLKRMESASKLMESMLPFSAESLAQLSEEDVRVVDQFIFRFSKLQDAIGERLFRAILHFLGEPIEGLPFIDLLNRLEKLHLLKSSLEWRNLRELRNQVAHNYDEPEELAALLNLIFPRRLELEAIVERIEMEWLDRRGK